MKNAKTILVTILLTALVGCQAGSDETKVTTSTPSATTLEIQGAGN